MRNNVNAGKSVTEPSEIIHRFSSPQSSSHACFAVRSWVSRWLLKPFGCCIYPRLFSLFPFSFFSPLSRFFATFCFPHWNTLRFVFSPFPSRRGQVSTGDYWSLLAPWGLSLRSTRFRRELTLRCNHYVPISFLTCYDWKAGTIRIFATATVV